MMAFVRVTSSDEFRSGDMAPVVINGHRLLVVCLDGEFRVYADRCAHLGMPLSRGTLVGSTLTCSAHHFQYDASCGRGINPRNVCLKAYPVKLEDGQVYVDIGEPGGSA